MTYNIYNIRIKIKYNSYIIISEFMPIYIFSKSKI